MPDTGPRCQPEPPKPATRRGIDLHPIIDRSQAMLDHPQQMYPDGFVFDKWDSLVSALGDVFNSNTLNGVGVGITFIIRLLSTMNAAPAAHRWGLRGAIGGPAVSPAPPTTTSQTSKSARSRRTSETWCSLWDRVSPRGRPLRCVPRSRRRSTTLARGASCTPIAASPKS